MSNFKEQLQQWIEREADQWSDQQEIINHGLEINHPASYYRGLYVGFEAGAHSILPMLLVAVEALEFDCGNRCNAEYNPCNAREALNKIKSMMEGNGNE